MKKNSNFFLKKKVFLKVVFNNNIIKLNYQNIVGSF